MAKSLEDQKALLTIQLIVLSGPMNFLKRRKIQQELDRINKLIKEKKK